MSRASQITFIVGDVREVIATLQPGSVQSCITSPPYWRKRSYIDPSEPIKQFELGQEASPGEFIANLLTITDALWDVVAEDGTIWVNLGDTAAGSGGWGGDVDKTNRGGGRRWKGTNGSQTSEADMPRAKSVCWIPELFGASLAYGRNMLSGDGCRQWITRPSVVWCKPAPTPGQIIDKFREATELIVWGSKAARYYFDLDAVREPPKEDWAQRSYNVNGYRAALGAREGQGFPNKTHNEKGVPPLNYWVINTSTGTDTPDGAHFATYPEQLIQRPVIASCPAGGTILDPFGGSGTTGICAARHGRNAVLIDLDPKNLGVARHRIAQELRIIDETSDGNRTTWTVEAPLPNQRAQVDGQRNIFDELGASA